MCCLKYKTSPSKTRSTEKQNKAQTGRKGLRQHLCGCLFVCSQIIISWLVSRTGPAAAWGRSSACFTSYFWLWSESQPTGVGMGVAVASLCYLVGSACLRGFSDTRFLYTQSDFKVLENSWNKRKERKLGRNSRWGWGCPRVHRHHGQLALCVNQTQTVHHLEPTALQVFGLSLQLWKCDHEESSHVSLLASASWPPCCRDQRGTPWGVSRDRPETAAPYYSL